MAGGGGKRHCALTETQMARLIGGGGRAGYGGVVGEMADAFLRWFASSATAKLARQQWRPRCAAALRL